MTRRARILVPGDPSAVAFARDRVLGHVRAWGVPLNEDEREAVKLVASELVTNAVVHAAGLVTVGLHLNDERLLLVVHDGNRDEPRLQDATAEDEGGRGLALVDSLATCNGWDRTPNGKKVWAKFEVPAPAPAARGEVLRRRRMKASAPRAFLDARPPPTSSAGSPAPRSRKAS
ncbi:ATP-binding protein [Streptomyces sp. NPDC004647]|uniref:ATP-binding protein n=1 Tax=Streptomyces sp. NPDC004647 TaxID=3154671 RepID=UPI0033ABE108